MTRASQPTWSRARRAIRAMVGPILPPAPSSTMSPPTAARASPTPGNGRDRSSSSSASSRGQVVGSSFPKMRVVAVGTDRPHVVDRNERKAFLSAAERRAVPRVRQETDCNGYPPCIDRKEHTSELQSRGHLVCRLLLEKKN